jgi:hypothetical protein
MKRRELLVGLLVTATTASAQAQQKGKVYRLAVVDPINPVTDITEVGELPYYRGFFEGLRELGFAEGRNLEIKRYSGEGHSERYGDMVREVVNSRPDMIFVFSTRLLIMLKEAAPGQVISPQAIERFGPIQLLCQRPCSGRGFWEIGRRIALRGDLRRPESGQQIQLLLPAPVVLGQAGKQLQSLDELSLGFGHRRAGDCLLTRLEPVSDRLFGKAGLGTMVRRERWLSGHDLRKFLLQRGGDPGVQLLSPTAQQRAVGRILHQRVLESVLSVRWRAAPKD